MLIKNLILGLGLAIGLSLQSGAVDAKSPVIKLKNAGKLVSRNQANFYTKRCETARANDPIFCLEAWFGNAFGFPDPLGSLIFASEAELVDNEIHLTGPIKADGSSPVAGEEVKPLEIPVYGSGIGRESLNDLSENLCFQPNKQKIAPFLSLHTSGKRKFTFETSAARPRFHSYTNTCRETSKLLAKRENFMARVKTVELVGHFDGPAPIVSAVMFFDDKASACISTNKRVPAAVLAATNFCNGIDFQSNQNSPSNTGDTQNLTAKPDDGTTAAEAGDTDSDIETQTSAVTEPTTTISLKKGDLITPLDDRNLTTIHLQRLADGSYCIANAAFTWDAENNPFAAADQVIIPSSSPEKHGSSILKVCAKPQKVVFRLSDKNNGQPLIDSRLALKLRLAKGAPQRLSSRGLGAGEWALGRGQKAVLLDKTVYWVNSKVERAEAVNLELKLGSDVIGEFDLSKIEMEKQGETMVVAMKVAPYDIALSRLKFSPQNKTDLDAFVNRCILQARVGNSFYDLRKPPGTKELKFFVRDSAQPPSGRNARVRLSTGALQLQPKSPETCGAFKQVITEGQLELALQGAPISLDKPPVAFVKSLVVGIVGNQILADYLAVLEDKQKENLITELASSIHSILLETVQSGAGTFKKAAWAAIRNGQDRVLTKGQPASFIAPSIDAIKESLLDSSGEEDVGSTMSFIGLDGYNHPNTDLVLIGFASDEERMCEGHRFLLPLESPRIKYSSVSVVVLNTKSITVPSQDSALQVCELDRSSNNRPRFAVYEIATELFLNNGSVKIADQEKLKDLFRTHRLAQ